MIWGHLKLMGQMMKIFPERPYMQAILTHLKHVHDLPDIFYLDLWPFGPKFVIITNPEASAIPTTIHAYPQATLVKQYFAANVGSTFIEATNDNIWKNLHQTLAPGLTPAAVRSYHDIILDEAVALHDRLQAISDSDEVCQHFGYEFGKFPFEVVGRIFLGKKVGTQGDNVTLYNEMQALAETMSVLAGEQNIFSQLRAKWDERVHTGNLRKVLAGYVESRFEELREKKVVPTRTTAASLLDRMLAPHLESSRPLTKVALTPIIEK